MQAGGLFDQAGYRRRGAVRQSRTGPARGQIHRRDAAVQYFCFGLQGGFSHLGGLINALTGSTAHRIPDPPGHLGHLSATHGWGRASGHNVRRRDAAVQYFCFGIQGGFCHLGGLIDALTGSAAHRIPNPPGHLGHLSATHGWGGLRRDDMGRRHRAGLVRGFIIISFIMSKHRVAVSWRLTGRVRLLR
ncbi:rhs accessory tic element domain protein [Yersinia pestis]|nr:rhs accessory tic element domain protein [Yersinia pestis]